jgi:membrane-associated protease RseP (regulator of RpoE activity)
MPESELTPSRHSARETRLLLLTLAVSIVALLLLARFRFPERPLADLTPPQSLARLARETAFDELSATLGDLLRQVSESVVVVNVAPSAGPSIPAIPGDISPNPMWPAATTVPALRIRTDLAIAYLPYGRTVTSVGGIGVSSDARDNARATSPLAARETSLPPDTIVGSDEERSLVVVRVPMESAPALSIRPQTNPLDAPGFVAVLEAAPNGPTIRAVFVSRYAVLPYPGWESPIVTLADDLRAQAGALIFTLNGSFVGMVLDASPPGLLASGLPEDRPALTVVAPSEMLIARANRLASGERVRLVDAGLGVQPLTPAVRKATGASAGVLVNAVHSAPPITTKGTDQPQVGDVITEVDGRTIRSPSDWQQALRARGAGATLRLAIVRFGKPIQTTHLLPRQDSAMTAAAVTPNGTSVASPATSTNALGASLRAGTHGLDLIAVRPDGAAARAGLRAGDRVTALPGRGTATEMNAAYASLASGHALLVAVERRGAAFVTAIEKP